MRCARKGSLVGSLVGMLCRFSRTESVTCEISVGTRMKGGGLLSSAVNPRKYFTQPTSMTSGMGWKLVMAADC